MRIRYPQFDASWWERRGNDSVHDACERNQMWTYLKEEMQSACTPGVHAANNEIYSGCYCETDEERHAYAHGYVDALYEVARMVYYFERQRLNEEADAK